MVSDVHLVRPYFLCTECFFLLSPYLHTSVVSAAPVRTQGLAGLVNPAARLLGHGEVAPCQVRRERAKRTFSSYVVGISRGAPVVRRDGIRRIIIIIGALPERSVDVQVKKKKKRTTSLQLERRLLPSDGRKGKALGRDKLSFNSAERAVVP